MAALLLSTAFLPTGSYTVLLRFFQTLWVCEILARAFLGSSVSTEFSGFQGVAMQIFIDTANLDEIKEALDMGVLDGVTTNPTLIAKEGRGVAAQIETICGLASGPVSAEVIATDAGVMFNQAKELSKIAGNVVIKLPATAEGLKALKQCRGTIRTNMTLVFQPLQALLVAKLGARFCSLFIGRLDDIGHDGMQVVADIRRMYDNFPHFDTEILAASLRHPRHVVQAAMCGADAATLPLAIIKKLLNHPLTDSGQEKFLSDYRKLQD